MKKYKMVFFALALAGSFYISKAQQTNDSLTQKLDEYLTSFSKAYKFNGSVLIAKKGKILLQKGYGWKNAGAKTMNDGNGIFQIGSNTKPFTATVILKLQEQGKLSVNDKLDKYLPDYPNGKRITIENLLTHTSGIASYDVDEKDTIAWKPVSKDDVLTVFKNKPLEFKPGKKYEYSNSGYFLLGMIIEKVTGKTYWQAVKEIIFDPLEMMHSGFDFINLNDTLKTTGYSVLNADKQIPAHLVDSTVSYAAGSLYSTTEDLYKWAKAIADKKILLAQTWQKAFTPFKGIYGYGWFIGSMNGESYVGHSGGITGFTSYLLYFSREDVTIILLNNFLDEAKTEMLPVQDLSAIIFNKPYTLYKEKKEIKINATDLNQYVGTYAFSKKPKRKMIVTKQGDDLFANLPGVANLKLIFNSSTKFQFQGVSNAEGEFVVSGDTVKIVVSQNGLYEWNKIN